MSAMNTSLRRTIATAVVSAGLSLVAGTAQALEGTFSRPTYKGLARLDNCYVWGRECGQRAADTYCRVQGYERAVRFTTERVRPTRIAVDGQVCNADFCVGFATITCSTSQPKRGKGVGWPQRID